MPKTPTIRLAALGLPAVAGGELLLLPAGQFDAPDGALRGKGPWTLSDPTGLALAARLRARGRDLPIDYEHQTLLAAQNGQPAPAAGWVVAAALEFRPGSGLVATEVRWTERAAAMLSAGEYRYLSPVFTYADNGQVLDFLHLALTNTPALPPDLLPEAALAAACYYPQEPPMDDLRERVLALLNLPVTSDDATLSAQLDQLQTLLAGQTAAASLPELFQSQTQRLAALGAQLSAAPPIEALAALQAEVASLKNAALAQERSARIASAVADGRLLPALQPWAEQLDLATLDAYLAAAQPIAALTGTQTGGHAPAAAAPQESPEERLVMRGLGLSAEQFLKAKH